MTRHFEEGLVRTRRELGGPWFVLELQSPKVAAAARPGQFAMVSVRPAGSPAFDPLLPRPLAFLDVKGAAVSFLIRAVGRGTLLLTRAEPGDRLQLLGPLGRGFELPPEGTRAVFVAGGVGVAPFVHFARSFSGRPRPVLLYGGRTAADLVLLDELREGMDVELATEDGTAGAKGLVTALLQPHLQAGKVVVYTCGPEPMMAAVARMAPTVPVQASLEARMACGIGVCRGCAVPKVGGGYLEACVDGPVHDAHEVWG